MVERSVYMSTGLHMVERSVYSLLSTGLTWLKDLCIVYWTSHG